MKSRLVRDANEISYLPLAVALLLSLSLNLGNSFGSKRPGLGWMAANVNVLVGVR